MQKKFLMSQKHLKNAMEQNRFIIVRHDDGDITAVNCGVLKMLTEKIKGNDEKKVRIISYQSCSFHEYISLKTPFL